MLSKSKQSVFAFAFLVWMLPLCSFASGYADTSNVILYTSYTKINVVPGQIVDYTVDLINNTKKVIDTEISFSIPKGWQYNLKSGNLDVRQMSVLPGDKRSLNLTIIVPLMINKGSYRFHLNAGSLATLPLTLVVSEQGISKTEFTCGQPNMQGPSTGTFTFETVLKNFTGDKQNFALISNAPNGWNISFASDIKKVTAIEITANNTSKISVEVDPPDNVEAGLYKIPVRAVTNTTSASLSLEVVITGSYGIELTTPTGLLSSSITAGDQKKIELVVRNTGSLELDDIQLNKETPINWEVSFEPQVIKMLAPGKAATVYATLKASKKAIAGDYVTNLEARTQVISSKAQFRISVKTSMIWGWVGIFIIVAAAGSVYYLFRKYGRR